MDQSSDTNRTRMEHILLLEITIGYKYLGIISTRLGNKLIFHSNQSISKIDKWLHGESDVPFGILNSGKKMIVYFGWNADDKIGMNPSRTIGSPLQQITSTRQWICDIFDLFIKI